MLTAGTRLGSYEILEPLGAGGMGEVYRATDARLGRDVAIKVLPAEVAGNPERLARLQREAQLLASLNHPHIAAIYGLEECDTGPFLVLELIEGEDLAQRLRRAPIPVEEALEIARQTADALEEAHGKGIIHRDLKPANVKVRDDGTVKVLDFGLAKAMDPVAAQLPVESLSPTQPSPAMSAVGAILGTAAYMAPEQARGRAVDKRADVWAFGALLYEMLTGAPAFRGEDTTELIAAVVKTTPDWAAFPAEVSPRVRTLVQRCLEKDRKKRIGDVAVARFLLEEYAPLGTAPEAAGTAGRTATGRRQALPWVLAALLAGAALGWLGSRRPAGPTPVTHLQMSVSPADRLVGSRNSVRPSRTALAISPDGRRVAFSATRGSVTQLYLRGLDHATATPVPGTDGAIGPFFSPDGEWIGFWADDALRKVPTAGGPPSTIADVSDVAEAGLLGATWGSDGSIVFANTSGLFRVASVGGAVTPIASPDASTGERFLLPHALPGGSALLFTAMAGAYGEAADVVLQPLDTGERRVLIRGAADARYVRTGHLVYVKSGTLMAVPFDVRSQQVTGAPVALIEDVMQAINAPLGIDETGAGQFAVSDSGTLVYVRGRIAPVREDTLVWADRSGDARPVAAVPPGAYWSYRVSPDGQKFTVFMPRGASRQCDVWVYDLRRGAPTRLTFAAGDASPGANVNPIWSPDGTRIVYASDAGAAGNFDLYAIDADGSGTPERLTTGSGVSFPSSWSSAANAIAFVRSEDLYVGVTHAIWVLPLEGDREPRMFLESRFGLMQPEFSPDGRWIAYVSDESGNEEVYVRPYPGPGEKIRISTDGGSQPIWTADGEELLYTDGTGTNGEERFYSVAIRSLSPFQTDLPRLLFEAEPGEYLGTIPVRGWDVSADGQRFLLRRRAGLSDPPVTTIQVVQSWLEDLERRVPSD